MEDYKVYIIVLSVYIIVLLVYIVVLLVYMRVKRGEDVCERKAYCLLLLFKHVLQK